MATPQELLSNLAKAYSFTETQSSGDPEYADAILDVQKVHGDLGWIVIRVDENGFSTEGEPVTDLSSELGGFHSALIEAGIQELRFQEVLESGVLEEFLRRLHPSSAVEGTLASTRFRGLEESLGLSFRGLQAGLGGMAGSIQELFVPPPPSSPEGIQGVEAPPDRSQPDSEEVLPSVEAEGIAGVPVIADSFLSQVVAEEVNAYLDGREPGREESERLLRARVEELTKARNVTALSEVVQLLVESEGEGSLGEEAIELAGEFTTPAVASHIVARLGSTRDELERRRLTRLISRIGREGALALTDALGESRDRFQRRAFMDAMVALGPQGLEMAQRMVEDPRWFVVRNGVSLLGELGQEGAVTHLTAALANGDSRVRKETVLNLGKVGGSDAEMLLLGMLDDGEGEVRAVACRALGALKSGRAFRPLLGLLKDEDVDVQVECLQALGQIGDPRAVPLAEKRALGGMFSRPSRDIRLAAFRALAGIGTPRALKTLQKGAEDRDEGVRTVVRTLIKEK